MYYSTRMTYAPLTEHAKRSNAGIDIRREYSVERQGKWVLGRLRRTLRLRRREFFEEVVQDRCVEIEGLAGVAWIT